jgi:hypothetical protein
VKLLVWTRGGYTVVHKRLERGKFVFASQVTSEAKSVQIDVHELSMLLEGIDVRRAKTSARWEPPKHVRAALTRKNFLFAGSDTGGERAAIAFTILSCCRLAGVNPVDYLADVLPRLSRRIRIRDLPALLPAPWKAARASSPARAESGRRRRRGSAVKRSQPALQRTDTCP